MSAALTVTAKTLHVLDLLARFARTEVALAPIHAVMRLLALLQPQVVMENQPVREQRLLVALVMKVAVVSHRACPRYLQLLRIQAAQVNRPVRMPRYMK